MTSIPLYTVMCFTVIGEGAVDIHGESLTITSSSNHSKIFKAGKNGFPFSIFHFPLSSLLESKKKKKSLHLKPALLQFPHSSFSAKLFLVLLTGQCTCNPIQIADKHFMRMKGMKGRFLRKLKSISTLKQRLVFQVNPPNQNFQTSFYREQEHKINNNNNSPPQLFPGNFSVPQVFNNVKDDQEMDSGFCGSGKENFGSPINSKAAVPAKDNAETAITLLSGSDDACTVPLSVVQLFKQSQTSAESLFDAKPLAFSEEMVMEHTHTDEGNLDSKEFPTLLDFEEKYPPGGSDSVVLYTTSLRGIRKTFEDCNSIRFLLESFRVLFFERDVSMHLEFREELWRMLGGRVVPPRLFIGGRLIGGADEVVGLHEQGKLKKLLQGMPLNASNGPCRGCAGVHFVLCSNCNGSCKVMQDGQAIEVSIRCPECNENGLIKCPICC